jgi:hypothetical protein
MTAFSAYELFIALVTGAFIGVVIVVWTNSQLRSSSAGALQAIQQSMGPLHNVCLFIVGGLPVACMWLLGTLRTALTALDAFAMIIMIGVAMVAALTLHGNMTKLLKERMSAVQSR